jgi:L-lysine exporter family protein LysE/ArgO
VLLTCAGLTFLNAHVYLDTVVLLGALAKEHPNGR